MKILLVEDEHHVSNFIRKGLEEASYTVTVAYDGVFGKKLALENKYDLIILDIILPHKSGLDVCKEIRAEGIDVPILMLTALGTVNDKVQGLEIGADDYLVKPFHFKELLARIKVLTRRRGKISKGSVYTIGKLTVDTNAHKVFYGKEAISLTAKELQLLEFLAKNSGKILSRTEILEHVWDISFYTDTNIVDVYINYLRKKIDKKAKHKLLHTVIGMGYVLDNNFKK